MIRHQCGESDDIIDYEQVNYWCSVTKYIFIAVVLAS